MVVVRQFGYGGELVAEGVFGGPEGPSRGVVDEQVVGADAECLGPPVTGPAGLAGEAAELVRALNHATLPGTGGLAYPADAYDVTGALSLLASRLPQALAQLLAFLQTEVAVGRVVIVSGDHAGDPAAVLAAVTASLDQAVASARRLHQALDAAQNNLTWAAARSQ